jgi:polyisoprenoid-binding protein YceI
MVSLRLPLYGLAAALLLVAAAAARSNWIIDPKKTKISFAVDAKGWPKTSGVFHDFEGNISVDFEKPRQSRVMFKVRTGSVDVGSDLLANLIRSSAFFNADTYRESTFVSTLVEKTSAKTVRVTGNLTLLGVTHPETFDVIVDTAFAEKGRLGYKATGSFERSKYGMVTGIPLISNVVELEITTEQYEQRN